MPDRSADVTLSVTVTVGLTSEIGGHGSARAEVGRNERAGHVKNVPKGGTLEPCTKLNRYCVSPAVCNKATKSCVCPVGTFGNGLIDCVDNGFSNCVIVEDPKITQFPGSNGALYLPCRKRLAKFVVGVADSDLLCRFTVFGLSELASGGRVFENEVEVELSLGRLAPVAGQTQGKFVAVSTIYFRINEEDGVLWTIAETGWLSNGMDWAETPWQDDVTVAFGNVTIVVTFDSDNVMSWRVPACDVTFKFRPVARRENPQTRVPGISITAPPRASFSDAQCQFPNVLCATPDDDENFLEQAATSLGLTVNQYLMYASLRYAPKQTRGSYKFECYLVCNLFKTKCSPDRQLQAIRICASLLTKRRTLTCIQQLQTSYNAMDLFEKCVHFVCRNEYYACQSLLKFTKRCPKAMKLKNLDCGPHPFRRI
ncbi:uncharacterized protein LOC143280319 [Babylonia areolata]|uniref:uncharacterized protein LOC143280319 n=1 Tax=Babylonia areolata TaxID=304850 RepID=UPI003FD3ED74